MSTDREKLVDEIDSLFANPVSTHFALGKFLVRNRQRILTALRSQAGVSEGKIPQSVIDFEQFLNEPPQYEDRKFVRDYRHEAYQKWKLVLHDLRAILSRLAAAPQVTPDK